MILSTYKIKDMEMINVEKERKIKTLSLVALIVAVLGLTVAFAALSQTLTINGAASVDAAEWNIHFENLYYCDVGGTINEIPELNNTSITGIDATITKPNDYIEFNFDIVNAGTIDAKIESVDISKLCTLQSPIESCDWNNDGIVTQEDINKVNNNITFTLFYILDGSPAEFKKGDILKASDRILAGVRLDYNKVSIGNGNPDIVEATDLPKRNLTFDDLSAKINYVQAN